MEKKSKATRAVKSLPMKAAESVAVRGGGKKKTDQPVKFMEYKFSTILVTS